MSQTFETVMPILAALVLAACGPSAPLPPVGGDTTTSTSSAGSSGGPSSSDATSLGGSSTGPAVSTSSSSEAADGESGCFSVREGMSLPDDCDVFTQDCPPCEKCMPWANDGGGAWNATRCSPVEKDPGPPGAECSVWGSGTSGMDDCERGSMCWDVDPKTNLGTCVAMCTGSVEEPVCAEPGTGCYIGNDGVIALCLTTCDPIEPDCPVGQGCYFASELWTCVADASGDAGGYGDPCGFVNVCDPGLVCFDASATPGCEGADCCTELCDLGDPAGDAQCIGAPEGQICQPWYDAGTAPRGYENVGVCALPA